MSESFNNLTKDLAIQCFQFCYKTEFIRLFTTNKHWYNLSQINPLAWRHIIIRCDVVLDYFKSIGSYTNFNKNSKSDEELYEIDLEVESTDFVQSSKCDLLEFANKNPTWLNCGIASWVIDQSYPTTWFYIASFFSQIVELDLFFNYKAQNLFIVHPKLLSFMYKLEMLTIQSQISVKDLAQLGLEKLPRLNNLNIWNCDFSCTNSENVELLIKIFTSCQNLTTLWFARTSVRYSLDFPNYVHRIIQNLPNLTDFYCDECINGEGLNLISECVSSKLKFELHFPFKLDVPLFTEWCKKVYDLKLCRNFSLYSFRPEINDLVVFELSMKYLQHTFKTIELEDFTLSSSPEVFSQFGACSNLTSLNISYKTRVSFTFNQLSNLQPIHKQLLQFKISNIECTNNDLKQMYCLIENYMINLRNSDNFENVSIVRERRKNLLNRVNESKN